MVFDESRSYSALTADKLNIGDIVYAADSPAMLREHIEDDNKLFYGPIKAINKDDTAYRFIVNDGCYALAYLVEKAGERKERPYKNCEELMKDYKRVFDKVHSKDSLYFNNSPEELVVWVKNKRTFEEYMVTGFCEDGIIVGRSQISFDTLYDNFTYLNGDICGIRKVEE